MNPRASTPSATNAVVAILTGLTAAYAAAGCDSSERQAVTLYFRELQVVSAYPARRTADGAWTRECTGSQVDGMMLNAVFVSSPRTQFPASSDGFDFDNSVRPGDVVNSRRVSLEAQPNTLQLADKTSYAVALDCVDPLHDSGPPNTACAGASGGINDSVAFNSFQVNKRNQSRSDALEYGHNIMLLIDQSGSIQGLVDKDTLREGDPQIVGANIPSNFGQVASDQPNLRHSAVKSFIRTLNERDQVGVIAFGEGLPGNHLKVPCASDQVLGNVDDDLKTCFGRDHHLWTDEAGISALGGGKNGRANLWQAVDRAYEFLVQRADQVRTNHIVIVTDGPDTCTFSAEFTTCQSPCSTTDYGDLLERVVANQANPNGVPIHIHFVQFESLGYPGRDPRQMELACLTEGHYQYINTNDLSDFQSPARLEPMEQALDNVRHSLMGTWQFAIASTGYASNTDAPSGALYGLSGTIKLLESANPTPNGSTVVGAFGVGSTGSIVSPAWDRRAVVRKPCNAATDCGAPGEPTNPCRTICSPETRLCLGDVTGAGNPDTSACVRADGGAGQCCAGTCDPANQLCSACIR